MIILRRVQLLTQLCHIVPVHHRGVEVGVGGRLLELHASSTHSAVQAAHLHVAVGASAGPGSSGTWAAAPHGGGAMEAAGAGSAPDEDARLFEDPRRPPGWAYLHKAITVMAIGCLASAAGGLLFLLRWAGATEASASAASSCVSVGLMLVVMGLVWIPVLKEKRRRKQYSQGG